MSEQKFYKFLGPNLSSSYDKSFYYDAPRWDPENKKWAPGEWTNVPIPDTARDNEPCGVGLHLIKRFSCQYGKYIGNCYEAEGEGLLGEDEEKARFEKVRLIRPVPFEEIFHEKAQLNKSRFPNANLRYANLRYANLRYANLSNADLTNAVLSNADLRYAVLSNANLTNAVLSNADLTNADLTNADLTNAVLSESHGLKDNLSADQKKQIIGEPHC